MIRFVLFVLLAAFLVWCGTTVKLGDHTFYGHVKRIWQSDETMDLRDGIKHKATTEMRDAVKDADKEAKSAAEDAAKGAVKDAAVEARPRD